MKDHTVTLNFDRLGLGYRFDCHAVEGAECRRWCDTCGGNEPPSVVTDCDSHKLADRGYCGLVPLMQEPGETSPAAYTGPMLVSPSFPIDLTPPPPPAGEGVGWTFTRSPWGDAP